MNKTNKELYCEHKDFWLTNRHKKRMPKKRLFYCYCDLNVVSEGQKCEVCKRRVGSRRDKKW